MAVHRPLYAWLIGGVKYTAVVPRWGTRRCSDTGVPVTVHRLHLKCDGKRAETRFRLSAKRTSPFKSAGASVQSTTGSWSVRISGSNAGYIMFRGSVKGTGYPLHSSVSPSLPLSCVTVGHHISTGVYKWVIKSVSAYLPRNQPHVLWTHVGLSARHRLRSHGRFF